MTMTSHTMTDMQYEERKQLEKDNKKFQASKIIYVKKYLPADHEGIWAETERLRLERHPKFLGGKNCPTY